VSPIANDDMIEKSNAEKISGLAEPLGDRSILG
jgi:hypothetical protein